MRHRDGPTSDLHELRLELVARAIAATGARSVLDLGCGDGELLARLATVEHVERLVGIDVSPGAVREARALLGLGPWGGAADERVVVRQASFTEPDPSLAGFDLAVMLETIEHIDPARLGAVERTVFTCWRPRIVLVTTPNHEYNVVYGVPPGAFRDPDHRFEWTRERFRRWAAGVAARAGYHVVHDGIGHPVPLRGAPTQMATFTIRGGT